MEEEIPTGLFKLANPEAFKDEKIDVMEEPKVKPEVKPEAPKDEFLAPPTPQIEPKPINEVGSSNHAIDLNEHMPISEAALR